MKADHKSSHRVPAAFVYHYKQPGSWLALVSPYLRHVNMCTLALLMFVGFAVLTMTHRKGTEIQEPVFAGNTTIRTLDNGQHEAAQVATELTAHSGSTLATLWQFLSHIVNGFQHELNDPALIEYAKEQGIGTSDLPTTICQARADHSRFPSPLRSTY